MDDAKTATMFEYPHTIAAKMAISVKSVTQEDANQFITDTKRLHELCCAQDTIIRELRQELDVSEQTVRLLQIEDV